MISFKEVINILLKASFETEEDDTLKRAWTDQGYSEFCEYFKNACPNAF
jgi:hypothetical protein